MSGYLHDREVWPARRYVRAGEVNGRLQPRDFGTGQ